MLQKGDRVVALHRIDDLIPKDATGTVARLSDYNVGVVWDEFVYGHTLGGTCEDGFGWWVIVQDIAIVDEEEPDIESDISDLL